MSLGKRVDALSWAMAYHEFTLESVRDAFGLKVTSADLFSGIEERALDESVLNFLQRASRLVTTSRTEKAKSEFIIAPVLVELAHQLREQISLFSGVEFNVDRARGLNGVCDFVISRVPREIILGAPVVTVVESKNDNIGIGLGQCIAEMVAAQFYNQSRGIDAPVLHGVVTIGFAWQFMRLEGQNVTVDSSEYYLNQLPKVFGILTHVATYSADAASP